MQEMLWLASVLTSASLTWRGTLAEQGKELHDVANFDAGVVNGSYLGVPCMRLPASLPGPKFAIFRF